jgi:U2-associated protein SR140
MTRVTRHFQFLLENLDMSRGRILEAMVFALDHGDEAEALSELLLASLSEPDTEPALKIARLYLLSDILVNTNSGSARKASVFLRHLSAGLDAVAASFANDLIARCSGRMSKELVLSKVRPVFELWAQWSLLPFGKEAHLIKILTG